MREGKLFAGQRLRKMRNEMGLTQVRMAGDLGISTSYLNLVERNQRPISARLLLKLSETYDVSLQGLAENAETSAFSTLHEVFSDSLFSRHDLTKQDLKDIAAISPAVAEAINTLYRAYREKAYSNTTLTDQLITQEGPPPANSSGLATEEVRDFLQSKGNHFAILDEAAEALFEQICSELDELGNSMRTYLKAEHDTKVQVMSKEVMHNTLRRYDRHLKRLMLSELLGQAARNFQIAHQIAILGFGRLLDHVVEDSGLVGAQARKLCRVQLANYFAAALLMPYGRFLEAAERLRYDIEVLGRRFGTSFEATCRRLTTLQRSDARGIPFFMIRIDNAGNVSKRIAAAGFHFARYGGACPRWNVHDAFSSPGRLFTQIIQLPDGAPYFSIARTVTPPRSPYGVLNQQLAVGLGCEIRYAEKLVYADNQNLKDLKRVATPIGINCRLCERQDCAQRAFPPLNREIVVDERLRGVTPFGFKGD